ncbi:hypothetical protein APHAL10511_008046 [Amanita phalloides]|nr:hypothetical protein APHAL10511_008046 [Amanita phalloides]
MSWESLRLEDIRHRTLGASETVTLLSTQGVSDSANNSDSGDDDRTDSDWQNVDIDSAYKEAAPKSPSFWPQLRRFMPIIALAAQFIMLVLMILIISISAKHIAVPSYLAHLFLEYSQFVPTVVTLIATLLSLINTQLFAEAVRFAIAVSLGNPELNGMSLYSFYAATVISSRSPLLNLNRQYIHWAIISIVYFLLFLTQTAAWTTILTPKQITVPSANQISLMDYDFRYANNWTTSLDSSMLVSPWAQLASSGITAIRQWANQTHLMTYFDHVLNGTTRGILPFPNIDVVSNGLNDWTQIEAIQQGFAVDVSCKNVVNLDSNFIQTKTPFEDTFNKTLIQIEACCDCSPAPQAGMPVPISSERRAPDYLSPESMPFYLRGPQWSVVVDSDDYPYIALAVCTARTGTDWEAPIIITSHGLLIYNLTCGVKLNLLNMNVTYSNSGFVTLNSTDQPVALNFSHPVWGAMNDLKNHFIKAQTLRGNNIADIQWSMLNSGVLGYLPKSQEYLTEVVMAAYIRGVIEQILTTYREGPPFSSSGAELKSTAVMSTTYAIAIVWGNFSSLKLAIAVIPLLIMVTTICVILLSIRRARGLTPKHIVSFNPMNTLHVIAACSSGNINARNALFPDYNKDIGAFGNNLRVRLPIGQEGAASGFQVDRVITV